MVSVAEDICIRLKCPAFPSPDDLGAQPEMARPAAAAPDTLINDLLSIFSMTFQTQSVLSLMSAEEAPTIISGIPSGMMNLLCVSLQ